MFRSWPRRASASPAQPPSLLVAAKVGTTTALATVGVEDRCTRRCEYEMIRLSGQEGGSFVQRSGRSASAAKVG